jgi:flagellar biosynthetic protein FliO
MEQEAWMTLLRTIGSLGLVLGLIFVMAWVFRRYIQPLQSKHSIDQIRVLATQDLGGKKKLMVVEFGGKKVLVGMTDQSMARLAEADLRLNVGSVQDAGERVSHA